jgi:murein DD-endopeptidase MepM/ murein hydrolase activator NlpD
VKAGWDGPYGNRVVIEHENGYFTTYNHMSAIGVDVGDEVTAGDHVGAVGDTGNSFGAHLHFEVTQGGDGWSGGSFVDPDDWLSGAVG